LKRDAHLKFIFTNLQRVFSKQSFKTPSFKTFALLAAITITLAAVAIEVIVAVAIALVALACESQEKKILENPPQDGSRKRHQSQRMQCKR
jgi:hypothetical protein